jgi:hypothetical protein
MDCAQLLSVVPQPLVAYKQLAVTHCCAAISGQINAYSVSFPPALACLGVNVFLTQCPVPVHGRKNNNNSLSASQAKAGSAV